MRLLLILLTCSVLAGCHESTTDGSAESMLGYLSSMDSIRVSLTVLSRHSRYEIPESVTVEGKRNYWFTNYDMTSTLEWIDTGFSAKAKFGFRQFTPVLNEYYFPQASSSTIAGFYNEADKTLRDVRCVLKFYQSLGGSDFQSANASLSIDKLRQGAVNRDSVEFFATGPELKDVVSIGFNSEESSTNGYNKKVTLDSLMWEDPTVEPELRVVFYPNSR